MKRIAISDGCLKNCAISRLNTVTATFGELPSGARFIMPEYNYDKKIVYLDIWTKNAGRNPTCQRGGYSSAIDDDEIVIPVISEHERSERRR